MEIFGEGYGEFVTMSGSNIASFDKWHYFNFMEKRPADVDSANDDAERPTASPLVRVAPAIACVIFLVLAVSVFALSENFARKTDLGFPTFQDSAFTLLDQNGVTRTNADFEGKPIALFFGFTYCPDVCPTTLLSLAGAMDDLAMTGKDVSDVQIIFVSVDYERDTPDQLKSYLSLFDVPVTGLTGNEKTIKSAIGSFGAYAQKIGDGDENYVYDHSAAVYLYRSDGTFKGTIVHNEPSKFMTEKLDSIL